MAIEVSGAQALFDNGVIPLVLRPFDIGVDPSRGITQPIITTEDGAITVTGVGPGLVALETLDLTNTDYTPAAGDLAPLVIGLNWSFDPDNAEYIRNNATRETVEFSGTDLRGLNVAATKWVYVGTDNLWHPQQGNTDRSLLASAARTVTTTSPTRLNPSSRAGHFILDVTAVTATPSITVDIQAEDALSGNFYSLLLSNAITTVGTYVFKIGPGYPPVPNQAANDNLPLNYRAMVTHADADSITYSLNANLFP